METRGKILFADDDEGFLYPSVKLLERRGYECDTANDALSAAKMLDEVKYNLLITDIHMPGNPKLEFVKALQEKAHELPVILVTGFPTLDTALDSMRLDVAAYLVKPFDFEELLVQVEKAMARTRVSEMLAISEKRLDEWRDRLNLLKESMAGDRIARSGVGANAFINLTLRNVLDSLEDLTSLTELLTTANGDQGACHLLECPRLKILSNSIVETVEVLEKTKQSFKSKDLGRLRKKLIDLVDRDREQGKA